MDPALPVPTAQGTFAKTPWPHLLVYAFDRRLTGTFELTVDGASVATMLVLEGLPAKIRTTDGHFLLGHVMVELGQLTQAHLAASLAHFKPDAGEDAFAPLHGEVLQQLGFATAEAVTAGLVAQLELKIARLFELPPTAEYAYFDGYDALAMYGGAPTPTHPFPVLWRGIRQSPSSEHGRATLQKVEHLGFSFREASEVARFAIDDATTALLERLRARPMRVADRLAEEDEATRAELERLFYALVITKQIDLVDPATLPKLEPVDDAPSSPRGRAFARVNLQSKAIAVGPLIAYEPPVPRNANDSRISSPVPAAQDAEIDPSFQAWMNDGASVGEAPPTPEEMALRKKILERAQAIGSQDYFQMLGIGREASGEAIEKAFFALAKTWHPDRLPARLADVKDACTKVFSQLSKAHETLADDAKRQAYIDQLRDGNGGSPDEQAKVQAILDAATAFQKAEFFLKRNDLPAALEQAETACRLDEDQADYLAMRTWLEILRTESPTREQILEKIAVLDRCIVLKPNGEKAFFWRGQLYKRVDMAERAVHDFKKVAELNPRNLDAVREVRLYEMRSTRSNKAVSDAAVRPARASVPPPNETKSSLFGRLFKKS